MKYFFTVLLALNILAASEAPRFSIIQTGTAKTLEALIYEEGSLFKTMMVNHAGFLIENKGKYILFETGLGDDVHDQFALDMSWWAKPIFAYHKLDSIKDQIKDHYKIENIILSHAHWDHASGLIDYPEITTLVSEEEMHEVIHPTPNRTFPSQFKNIKTKAFKWKEEEYLSFHKYYDVFGDRNVIIVPLFGHTHGSLGIILNNAKDGKKYFFVGDAIWTTRQLSPLQNKPYLSSKLVDTDKAMARKKIEIVKLMQQKGYIIVPTHDFYVHESLGYYPKWN
ncbi:MBL fold metallo-hydrolase [Halobacteriovorax sp. RT-2-6]|uniref:MBL fold metallo-hydrolase n=1 Tax=unclassified Halobacteriovorax TaxID=2639665 RepID=UPI0039999BA9